MKSKIVQESKVFYRDLSKYSIPIAVKEFKYSNPSEYSFAFPKLEENFSEKFINSYSCIRKRHYLSFPDELFDILELYATFDESEKQHCFYSFFLLWYVNPNSIEAPIIYVFLLFGVLQFSSSRRLEIQKHDDSCLLRVLKPDQTFDCPARLDKSFFGDLIKWFKDNCIDRFYIKCGGNYFEMSLLISQDVMVFKIDKMKNVENKFLFEKSFYRRFLQFMFSLIDRIKMNKSLTF